MRCQGTLVEDRTPARMTTGGGNNEGRGKRAGGIDKCWGMI